MLKGNVEIQIWLLGGINTVLIFIASFFIRMWMSNVKKEIDDIKLNIQAVEDENQNINLEMGRRKGEIQLLKKDVEKLASDTLSNFDNVKIHLEYQKRALEDLKTDGKERKKDMDDNFRNLTRLINNK